MASTFLYEKRPTREAARRKRIHRRVPCHREERYHHSIVSSADARRQIDARQLQAWALNRYYYQSHIPIKDAAILARSKDPAFRVAWRKRIIDHDGDGKIPVESRSG